MRNLETISVCDVVGSSIWVASEDGDKVYARLYAALNREVPVSLSFINVSMLTPAFLNAAFGQLFGYFDEEKIRKLVNVEEMNYDDRSLLERVVDTAKEYYKDPERFDLAVKEALEEWDDED